jgi:hypothetical protein
MAALVLLLFATISVAAEAPDSVEIGNKYAQYVFTTTDGLKLAELNNSYTQDNNVKQPDDTRLFVITTEQGQIDAAIFQVADVTREETAAGSSVRFTLTHPAWNAVLTIAVDDTEESHWTLTVTSKADQKVQAKLSFPVLGGLVIGDNIATNQVYHGLNGAFFYDNPVRIRGTAGYSFPLLDIYDISDMSRDGGIYLRLEDRTLGEQKCFEVHKRQTDAEVLDVDECYWDDVKVDNMFAFAEGMGLAVTHQQYDIEPGATLDLPPASIGVHPYRWERCWENYRKWVNTWYELRAARPKWFRDVFVHKAVFQGDFRRGDTIRPEIAAINEGGYVNGLWVWHYENGGEYIPAKEIVKPYDDMYDFNHWYASRGEYDVRTDFGGPEPFAQLMADLRPLGVRSALYMEALSVHEESHVGRAMGPAWATLQKGERGHSAPPLREYAYCPGAIGWRRHFAHEVDKVLRDAKPDSVYLDSVALNYWLCEDTTHDHRYRRDYHKNALQLFDEVDQTVDRIAPETAVYAEFWNTTAATQSLSGSFSPVVSSAMGMEAAGKMAEVTGTNLFRFYFPDFKIIEIMPENKQGIELSLFNGNAIHGHFVGEEPIEHIQRLAPIWRKYINCFTSDDVQALLETGVANVYMNRFGTTGRQLYTVWNAAHDEQKAVALPVVVPAGWRAVDVLNDAGKELEVAGVPGQMTVTIDLPAHALSIFVVEQ